jgi:hypothetical protein
MSAGADGARHRTRHDGDRVLHALYVIQFTQKGYVL